MNDCDKTVKMKMELADLNNELWIIEERKK